MAEMIAMLNGLGSDCASCLGSRPITPQRAAMSAQRGTIVSQQYNPNLAAAPTTVADAARVARAESIVSQQYNARLAAIPTTAMSVSDQVRMSTIADSQYNARLGYVPAGVPASLPQRGGYSDRGLQMALSRSAAGSLYGLGADEAEAGWWSKQSTAMKAVYGVGAAALAFFAYKKFVR